MRKLLAILLLFGIPVVSLAQMNPAGHRVHAVWKFNYATLPACAGTNTRSCVSGFQVGTWNGSACSVIAEVPNAPQTDGIQWVHASFRSTASGTVPICVWMVWYAASGLKQVTMGVVEGKPAMNANISDFNVLKD